MNREMRRLQKREERRARKGDRPRGARRPSRGERGGVVQFMREVRVELSRVAWPNQEEVVTYSIVVLVTSVVLTLITFGMDVAFKEAVLFVLQRS